MLWDLMLLWVTIDDLDLRLDLIILALVNDLTKVNSVFILDILQDETINLVTSQVNNRLGSNSLASSHNWNLSIVEAHVWSKFKNLRIKFVLYLL